MSKPSSGLFSGTKGARNRNTHTSSQRTNNREHVVSWAKRQASKLEKESKTQREKFNTATVVYDSKSGKYYYGRNGGIKKNNSPKNPLLFGDKTHAGLLPKSSLNKYAVGNCSEVDAINKALNAGAKLSDLHVTTIHATKNSMGKSKRACENCTYSFKGKVKRNYTGWHKETK